MPVSSILMTKLGLSTARLVNGEHRIGIFASQIISYRLRDWQLKLKALAVKNMDPGAEILIDYGPAFFRKDEAEPSRVLP
jgi:hypothetical protein